MINKTGGINRKGKSTYCYECMDLVIAGVLEVRLLDSGIKRRTYEDYAGHRFVTHELSLPPQPQRLARQKKEQK